MNDYKTYRESKVARYMDSIKHGWRRFPPSLQVALTDVCFNNCITCGHWERDGKSSIELETYKDYLNKIKGYGVETICYGGGDPFCYPKINEVMEWHLENNVKYGFICSGYLPAKVNARLVRKAEWMRVSLDAVSEKGYKRCRGGMDVRIILHSIETARDKGVDVRFGITLHKHNISELDEVLDYVEKFGTKEVRVRVIRNDPSLVPSKEQTKEMIHHLRKHSTIAPSNNFEFTIQSMKGRKAVGEGNLDTLPFDRCYAVFFQLFISATGDIYPCCITAGDTEKTAPVRPIGSMHTELDELFFLIKMYNRRTLSPSPSTLPKICHTTCIPRLSSINNFCESALEKGEFI